MTDVKLSNPDKLLWHAAGITKFGLLEYYEKAWSRIERFVVNRPLSLVRAPDGVGGQRFFQKHAGPGLNKAVKRLSDPEDGGELLYIDSFDGLAALVQIGAVEIHVWGSTIAAIEQPDQIVFDLDPDEGLDVSAVRAAALEVRARLDEIGLPSFVKTTGGKGYHVVVPQKPAADWATVKTFTHDFAQAMQKSAPDRYTSVLSKKARTDRVFIDYLRNGRGATAIAPYSTRGKEVATIAMPIAWEDVESIAPDAFAIGGKNLDAALAGPDPWADFDKRRRALKS